MSNRILVVDDEEGLRATLAANLELEGYEVAMADSGAGAVAQVAASRFDLVITDVRMPEMNGLEAFRRIRKLRPGAPVIMMTAFTAESMLEQAVAEGVYTVIHKPFPMARVIGLVRRAIAGGVVLVVDDAPEQAASIVQMLDEAGIRAEIAHDGPSAVKRVAQGHVDLCVLDLVMPRMDGVTAYEGMRRVDPSIGVVAISAYSVPEMMHRLAKMGAHTCLRKPFERRDLVRAIARARAAMVRE